MAEERAQQFDPKQHVVTVGGGAKAITFVGLQARLQDQSKYIQDLELEVLQFPTQENDREAIVKATMVVAKVGKDAKIVSTQKVQEIGDASIKSTGKMIHPHTMRMACTRAEGRCLRLATRSPYVSVDEVLSGD